MNTPNKLTLSRIVMTVFFVMALLLLGVRSPMAYALESLESFPVSTLNIRTRQGPPEWFSVWIADTAARSEQGLMFVKWLPAGQGMLFPFDQPHVATNPDGPEVRILRFF